MSTESQGLRFNEGKLRYDLVHPFAHEGMVKVLTRGAQKYAPRNWEKGMAWSKVIASLKRHLAAIEKGEDYDSETGLLHADHLQCNAHFLSAYYKIAPQFDDRRQSYLNSIRIGLDIDGVLADFSKKLLGDYAEDVLHWNDPIVRGLYGSIKKDADFWLSLPVLTPSSELNFEPAAYVTSRSIGTEVTQKWLNDNGFPVATLVSVGHEESKVQTLKDLRIDVFVDDKFENFREINNAGIFCYLFDAPHNRKYNVGHKRISSLKDLSV